MKIISLNKLILKTVATLFLISALSLLLYGKADNNITPGKYSFIHDLEQKFYTYIYSPDFKATYTFINLDDETFDSLGNPSFTPPEVITRIVEFVKFGNPKLLIIDIDLRPSIEDNLELISLLKEHQSYPILFADIPSRADNNIAWRTNHTLDKIIEDNQSLFWVSTIFYPQSDGVIRQARYFTLYCNDNKVIVRPTVAFAVRLINDLGLNKFNELLVSVIPEENNSCKDESSINALLSYSIPDNNKEITLNASTHNFDIKYAIIKDGNAENKTNSMVVNELSAKGLASSVDVKNFSTETLEGRIVIAGGTNFESRDIHSTPVGNQYGVFLILNSIETALNFKYPYFSDTSPAYLNLLYFVLFFGLASVFLRNTFLVLTSLLTVILIPKIFNGSYSTEIFTVLAATFLIEVITEFIFWFKNWFCRISIDLIANPFLFFLSSEVREKIISRRQNYD